MALILSLSIPCFPMSVQWIQYASSNRIDPIRAIYLKDMIARIAKEKGVPVKLAHQLISTESAYNARAKHGPAVGMTQVIPRFHQDRFLTGNYYNEENNVRAGLDYLAECLEDAHGNQAVALALYNRGPHRYAYASKVLRVNFKIPASFHRSQAKKQLYASRDVSRSRGKG
jgi:soluble lytic murein transglycosylase-like protein